MLLFVVCGLLFDCLLVVFGCFWFGVWCFERVLFCVVVFAVCVCYLVDCWFVGGFVGLLDLLSFVGVLLVTLLCCFFSLLCLGVCGGLNVACGVWWVLVVVVFHFVVFFSVWVVGWPVLFVLCFVRLVVISAVVWVCFVLVVLLLAVCLLFWLIVLVFVFALYSLVAVLLPDLFLMLLDLVMVI